MKSHNTSPAYLTALVNDLVSGPQVLLRSLLIQWALLTLFNLGVSGVTVFLSYSDASVAWSSGIATGIAGIVISLLTVIASIPGRMTSLKLVWATGLLALIAMTLTCVASKEFGSLPQMVLFSFVTFGVQVAIIARALSKLTPADLRAAKWAGVLGSAFLSVSPTLVLSGLNAYVFVLVLFFFVVVGVAALFPKMYYHFSIHSLKKRTALMDVALSRCRLLKKGDVAPAFHVATLKGMDISLEQFRGKKVWLILYRYAKCPLCLVHFETLKNKVSELKARGIEVIAVFESMPSRFPSRSREIELSGLSVASDPGKALYKKFGTQIAFTALFHPNVLVTFIIAQLKGFFQGRIDGEIGQIPAHFLINADGTIWESYSGHSIADQIPWERIDKFIEAK